MEARDAGLAQIYAMDLAVFDVGEAEAAVGAEMVTGLAFGALAILIFGAAIIGYTVELVVGEFEARGANFAKAGEVVQTARDVRQAV